jgi:hypothetical protein
MPPLIRDVIYLRSRAREILALADKSTDPEEKRMALELVDRFLRLARRREKQNAGRTRAPRA